MTNECIGNIKGLYDHQVRTIRSQSSVVVLDAPTGSGKTLAALARVLVRRTPAIFVYPTNSLVTDQVYSIMSLLMRLGYQPNLIDEDWDPSSPSPVNGENVVDIIHATGETLEHLGGGAKGSVLERVLSGTDRPERMRILLTNPDTLYLVAGGFYYRHGRISDQLFKFQAVVVDEFHLYAGPVLARLVLMLNEMHSLSNPPVELLFLSATHGDLLDLLRGSYPDLDLIVARSFPDGGKDRRRIKAATHGEVRCCSKVLGSEKDAEEDTEEVAKEIARMYHAPYDWQEKASIKVLGIFSSVTFAIAVAKRVKEILHEQELDGDSIVKQIHGLVPKAYRVDMKSCSENILIGTSAIEVGVDFNVPFLVMEAHDLASFLQRFGRSGRHGPCEFRIYVPYEMATRLGEKNDWSYPDMIAQAEEAFRMMPSYAGFICSKQMRTLMLAMALAGSKEYDRYRREEDFDYKAAQEYFLHLLEANKSVSIGGVKLVDVIGPTDANSLDVDLKRYTVKVMAKYSFMRGSLNSLLVRLPGGMIGISRDHVISEMDVFDVFRLSGKLEDASKHWASVPGPLKKRYDEDSPVFVANEFTRGGRPSASIDPGAQARRKTAVFARNDTTLRSRDRCMTDALNEMLEKRNLVFFWRGMTRMTDYRIPRVYADGESGALVIGDWALVAEYLAERARKEAAAE
ncbi:MAG: type I-D CRISPR-associated helicase Cas3' [Candidatus Thorarchaeota archaeon]|nr:type I-D CRISPR-associated helicase Cas3' [Candidatus Thorarchaeota archaeon]